MSRENKNTKSVVPFPLLLSNPIWSNQLSKLWKSKHFGFWMMNVHKHTKFLDDRNFSLLCHYLLSFFKQTSQSSSIPSSCTDIQIVFPFQIHKDINSITVFAPECLRNELFDTLYVRSRACSQGKSVEKAKNEKNTHNSVERAREREKKM